MMVERLTAYNSANANVLGLIGVADGANINFANINFRNLFSSATGSSATIGCETDNTTDTGQLVFSTSSSSMNPSERMRIDKSGNVGIGVTNPTARLHISENGGSTDDVFIVNPSNGGNRTMTIDGQKIDVTFTNVGGSTGLELQGNGGPTTFGGAVSGITTLSTSGQITTGYGVLFNNGDTKFLMYNNTGDDLLYLRDTTNSQMLQTWTPSQTTIHKNLIVDGGLLTVDDGGDANEGGEIIINPGTSHSCIWRIDSFFGHLRFFGSDTSGEQMALTNTGNLSILTGTKFNLDGRGGHTYISETADDRLAFFVGNSEMLRLTNGSGSTDSAIVYVNSAERVRVNETGLKVNSGALGVNITALSDNGSIVATNDIIAGQNNGSVAMTINDGGGNANLTFNHRNKTPDQNGNSGRIEVNVDSSGGAYMAFEVASNVTSGVSVNTSEKLRIDDNGVDINGNILTGNSSNPTIEIRNTASSAGSGPALIFGHSQSGTSSVAKIDTHLIDGSESGRAGHLDFHTSTSSTMTHRMRIQSNGNVGIGVTSAQSELHIGTGNTARHIKVSDNRAMFGYDGANAVVQGGNTKGIEFNTNSDTFNTNTRMTITSAGNVGIGTQLPSTKLHIVGQTLSTNGYKTNNGSVEGFFTADTDNANFGTITSGKGLKLFTANTERMRIDSSGNVGIGETNPDSPLHFGSNVATSAGFDSFADYQILLHDTGTASTSYGMGIRGNTFMFNTDRDYEWRYENTAKLFFAGENGRLGIGTTSPNGKLDLSAHTSTTSDGDGTATMTTSGQDSILLEGHNGGASGTNYGSICWLGGSRRRAMITAVADGSTDTDIIGLSFYTQGTDGSGDFFESMRIAHNGNVHFDKDVIAFSTTPSDIRLKENFEKIENGLDVVSKLEGHTFNWKKGGERLSAGFKAQEVEKILPHLVDEKKLPLKSNDEKEYKTLRYEEMIPYLVEAIKEQQEEIELLKANYNQLKYNRR